MIATGLIPCVVFGMQYSIPAESSGSNSSVIDIGVEESIRTSGITDIVIAFRTEALAKTGRVDVSGLVQEITRVRGDILGSISATALEYPLNCCR